MMEMNMKTVIALLHEAAKNFNDLPYLGGKQDGEWKRFSFA
jgi:hypothetical protein